MKDWAQEFMLRRVPPHQWEVLPITYQGHRVDPLVSGSDHWTFSNPYGAQDVRIVIEAALGGVNNPGLSVNGVPSVQFEINLAQSDYLEFAQHSGLRVFNGTGLPQAGNVLSGATVPVQAGDNDIVFYFDQGQSAKVTLATVGFPLQIQIF